MIKGVLEDSGLAQAFRGQVAVMFLDAAQVSFARGTFADRIDVALAPVHVLTKSRREFKTRSARITPCARRSSSAPGSGL